MPYNAIYEAAQANLERARQKAFAEEDAEYAEFPPLMDWGALYADDDPLGAFQLGTFDAFDDTTVPHEAPPIEARASTSYRWGRRIRRWRTLSDAHALPVTWRNWKKHTCTR